MRSPYQRALAAADARFDQHMGEMVQITPMRQSDFGRSPDPQRPAFDCVALVEAGAPSTANIPTLDTRVVYEQWDVEVRRAVLGDRRVRKGDEIILLDRPGSPRVMVNHVERLDEVRVKFVCGPISSD